MKRSTRQPSPDPVSSGLPHRPPFLFVREIVKIEPGVRAECLTTFEVDDPIFRGHFPGNPLVPGVILTEALAQTAGIAAASPESENTAGPRFLLSAIRQMKFFRGVRPGEPIILRAERVGQVDDLLQFQVEAAVAGESVAAGQLVLNILRNPESNSGLSKVDQGGAGARS